MKKLIYPFKLFYQKRRELLSAVIAEVKYKYGGAILGKMWFILNPIFTLSVYGILYALVFRVRPAGLGTDGYILLVFTGLSAVITFTESLSISISSLSNNKGLLLNNIFPPELVVAKDLISNQLSTSFSFMFTCIISLIIGKFHISSIFLVPIIWISLMMFSIGIGWIFSLAGIVLKDLRHLISIIAMILTITSPYAYTPAMVPKILRIIMWFNPLTPFVLTLQSITSQNSSPNFIFALISLLLGFTSFSLGYSIFRKVKPTIFDYV